MPPSDPSLPSAGQIELICGCMFSGKTSLLLRRAAESIRRGLRVRAFKHSSDDRYARDHLVTHDGQRLPAEPVAVAEALGGPAAGADVVLIDEAQFFDEKLPEVCRNLADGGRRVIVAGLDRDAWGEPFGSIPALSALADRLIHTCAVCSRCGKQAFFTQRIAPITGAGMIGGAAQYEPRCQACFEPPPRHLRR